MTSDDDREDDFYDPQAARKKAQNVQTEPYKKIKRGDEVDLTRVDPAIQNALVGIGWDFKKFDAALPDLDCSLFLLDKNDRTREDEDFVFYNNMTGCEGAVRHMGDSRTGAGEGDDETLTLDLRALPYDIVRVVFAVSIYDLDLNDNSFDMVRNVYFRLVSQETGMELFRYDLDEELAGAGTAIIIGTLERIGANWIFKAVGESVKGGLSVLAHRYGIIVAQQMQI